MTELPNNLDTILHIGAGHGDELPAYMDSDAKQILLVEPNPNLAARLRARTQNDARVTVVETAITDDPAQNQLTEYNLPEAASLHQPTGLRQSFPGLRITAQHPVATSTLPQLLEQHALGKGNNLLVLQAPGAELVIIKALATIDGTEPFSHLWLTCPHEAFYSTASRASDALAELQRQGYDVQTEGAEHDDWPQWQLACNPLARKVQALEIEKQALTEALKQSKNELEYANATLASSKNELTEARKEFDQQQSAWQQEKQELTKRLEAAMQHSQEADNTLAKQQEREVELGAALNQANTVARQLRNQLEAAQTQNEELKAQGDEHAKELQQRITELENTATQQAQKHSQELAGARKDSESLKAQLQQGITTQSDLGKKLNETREQLSATEEELKQTKAWLGSRKKEAEESKQQLDQAQSALKSAEESRQELEQQLDAEQSAHANTKAELEGFQGELQKHKTYLANRKQQLTEAEQKIEQLEQQLKEQNANSQRFDQLEAKLAGITRNITGHMDKQLRNTSQQLESSIALQGYLQGGQLPMKPAGPALSANMALYMAEQIETSQYDLIIEFGSGASTGFLARTVLKRLANHNGDTQRLGYQQQGKDANGKELAFIAPDEDDLPKRIISFEHRKEQAAKIEQSLTAAGLQQVVELVHAPLVDYQHQDQHFLHYGCEKVLERLANLYEGRTAKFLILVNGPPSKTGPMARFPALPKLLNALGSHTMDIVFGDSLGDDANAIAERWCALLEQRGINFRKEVIHNEKAATRLAINYA